MSTVLGAPLSLAAEFCEPEGAERIAPFENASIRTTVSQQINAAGATEARGTPADATVVVHCPTPDDEPGSHDDGRGQNEHASVADAVGDRVEASLDSGHVVAVADARFPNGADPVLVGELARRGLLDRICAFSCWNTVGNTIGSVVAATVAHPVALRAGFNAEERVSRLRWHWIVVELSRPRGYPVWVAEPCRDR